MSGIVDSAESPSSESSSSSSHDDYRDLGEYRLLKRLGAGGMGRVYKAMHRRLEKLVAVKLLPSYRADDPRALARFDREIKAIGRVSHANIVRALDAEEIVGTRILVMEYIDGVDLSLLVRTCGRLPIADACELGRQAALGLQCAHEHGLVHRDVKPSNLMLSRAGELKILDLGLARFRAEPLEDDEMTDVGTTLGTAEYIAPEQALDSHRVDIRADIYSLGCTMYRLLTGQPPFFGPKYRSAAAKIAAHLREPPPSIRQTREEVSEPLAEVLGHMMAKNPDERYKTPVAVAAALAPHAAGSDLRSLVTRFEAARKSDVNPKNQSAEEAGPAENLQKESPAAHAPDAPPAAMPRVNSAARFVVAAAMLVLFGLAFAVGFVRPFLYGGARDGTAATGPVGPGRPNNTLCGKELPQNQWVDVLPYADMDRDRVSDYWEIHKDGIGCRGTSGYPRIALPVGVHGDYDLEVVCTRNSGDGIIRILFPVGDENTSQLLLAVDGGELHGFNELGGHELSSPENPGFRSDHALVNGKPFKVAISVRLHGNEATIDVMLDDQPLCHSTVAPSAFPAYHFSDAFEQVRPIIGVEAGSDATFHSARVRLAGGKGAIKPQRLTEACPKDQWIDLLPRIDLARDRIGGDFFYAGRGLRLAEGDDQGILMFPAALQGSYELEMEFTHSPSSGMVALVVPVGLRRVTVNVNNKGDIHPDAEWINRPKVQGEDGDEDAAASELEAGVRHKLFLKVGAEGGSASIAVRVDGKPWISWSGDQTDLSDGPTDLTESDRIGLVAEGEVTLHAARLRVNTGKGRLVLSEAAGQQP